MVWYGMIWEAKEAMEVVEVMALMGWVIAYVG